MAALPWLRGNLHCHTTESDGRLTPQQTVDWFAGAGYHFLALTDHNRVTDPTALNTKGLCLLTSTELTAAGGELGSAYHLVGLGLTSDAVLPPPSTLAAESVSWLRARGAVVFVAHPHWSGLSVADLMAAGAHGIEIYNGGTVLDSQRGEALTHWDEGLARGARWWGIAVDDTHWHTIDRGLGWVMVRAAKATPKAILHALAQGQFYSSSGPEIRQVHVSTTEDGATLVEVETSPCAAIYLLPFGARSQFAFEREAAARGETGATIKTARFTLGNLGPGGYVRIQCTDWQRRCAWSNPLFLST
jgi:predicted metal-dependent phosphoesterase TrpH